MSLKFEIQTSFGDSNLLRNFLLSTISLLWLFLWNYNRKSRGKNNIDIPGPKGLPIIGNAHQINRDPTKVAPWFRNLQKEFPRRTKIVLFGNTAVFLYNPEDIKEVLHTKQHLEKGAEYDVMTWIGTGALTANEKTWLHTRPVLDKGFRQTLLNKYKDVFCQKTQQLVQVLKEHIEKNPGPFDILPTMYNCGFDIISETIMATPSNTLGGETLNDYTVYMEKAGDYFHYRHCRPILYRTKIGKFVWKYTPGGRDEAVALKKMNDFSEQLIEKRKKALALEPDAEEPTCLLDILLRVQKHDPTFTNMQVRNEVDTFLTGGHGATTATSGMMLQLFAAHPEIQEKAYQEICSVLKENNEDPNNAYISFEVLNKLKYLECCIKECLRLFPGVPVFPRHLIRPVTLADGTKLPKGTSMLIAPFLLHRDPSLFPDPESFIPERFDKSEPNKWNQKELHPYAFIPFSAGPRYCIGKHFSLIEMKVYMIYLLTNFKLVKAVETEDITILFRVFLKSKYGVKISLVPRK